MSMPYSGMNIEEVRRLGAEMKGQGDRIGSLITEITKTVDLMQQNWSGPDATRFKGWWESEHRPKLTHAQEAITGLGQSALNNADEQESVSRR